MIQRCVRGGMQAHQCADSSMWMSDVQWTPLCFPFANLRVGNLFVICFASELHDACACQNFGCAACRQTWQTGRRKSPQSWAGTAMQQTCPPCSPATTSAAAYARCVRCRRRHPTASRACRSAVSFQCAYPCDCSCRCADACMLHLSCCLLHLDCAKGRTYAAIATPCNACCAGTPLLHHVQQAHRRRLCFFMAVVICAGHGATAEETDVKATCQSESTRSARRC